MMFARPPEFGAARRAIVAAGVVCIVWLSAAGSARADTWRAGAAAVNITPERLMWMSGYGNRDHPAEGKETDLWAKALVLEDTDGKRVALVSLDLVGIGRELSLGIRRRLTEQYGLQPAQVALCCSHTHTGPVVGDNLRSMYFYDGQQQARVDEYTAVLADRVVAVVGEAVEQLAPARLAWGNGHVAFAVNRRNNREADVPGRRERGELVGPVDYQVPVLSVRDGQGSLKAIVCGYACHATVLSFYRWSGDYPGFAKIELEKRHPGAVALFFAGCGADVNPLPRRTVELAEAYGRRLAGAVDEVLGGVMRPIDGSLVAQYAEIELPLATLPTRAQLESESESSDRFVAARATRLLGQIDGGRPLSQTYPYPVQTWRLGSELLLVTLGGEVVVDYALRLKSELGQGTTWVAGYTNDVMAYIPSRRVLAEGGYEGGGAMVYYGLPTVWDPAVEATIVAAVHAQADALKTAQP